MQMNLRDERGFTLIELLVVILIIGILAAIAIPNFVGQRDRSYDAVAKENARNTVSHVESCFVKTEDYGKCTTLADIGLGSGVVIGTMGGGVEILPDTDTGYEIKAYSKTGSTFSINKAKGTWITTRTCVIAAGKDTAGCKGSSW